jgi:Zn-dependent metalloprotease
MTHSHGGIRHSVLPPYILESLARNGVDTLRGKVIHDLSVDHSLRTSRAVQSVIAAGEPPTPASEASAGKVNRTIADAKNGTTLPGTTVRTEGAAASADVAVNEAYDGLGATYTFYWEVFQRNSIDGNGLPLHATVHYDQDYDNAFWDGEQMIFGDGDGQYFNRFTISVDVIGHELTHGVTGSERDLAYEGQSGALNESLSDVFGSMVKQYAQDPKQTAEEADWLIGAGLFTDQVQGVALRSMKAPGTAYDDPAIGKDPQPATMAGFVTTRTDNGGVHTNSGIPNHAFYLAAVGFGGYAWEKAGRIWYETVRSSSLTSNATFAQFAAVTVSTAETLFDAAAAAVVKDAWAQVGVTVA